MLMKRVTALFSFENSASPFIVLNPKLLFNVFIFSPEFLNFLAVEKNRFFSFE